MIVKVTVELEVSCINDATGEDTPEPTQGTPEYAATVESVADAIREAVAYRQGIGFEKDGLCILVNNVAAA